MKHHREIEDHEEYEKSIADRLYLGTLIVGGVVLGFCVLVILSCCYVKLNTGQWPNWL